VTNEAGDGFNIGCSCRGIGVVHRPQRERLSHRACASLSDPYDDFVWFEPIRA
jgi:erythromycin esterase-like protein